MIQVGIWQGDVFKFVWVFFGDKGCGYIVGYKFGMVYNGGYEWQVMIDVFDFKGVQCYVYFFDCGLMGFVLCIQFCDYWIIIYVNFVVVIYVGVIVYDVVCCGWVFGGWVIGGQVVN